MQHKINRRRIVLTLSSWAESAQVAVSAYEQWLLEQYACGESSVEQVVYILQKRASIGSRVSSGGFSLATYLCFLHRRARSIGMQVDEGNEQHRHL